MVLKLDGQRRVVRLVHITTGISVEDDATSQKSIVERRNLLEERQAVDNGFNDALTVSPPGCASPFVLAGRHV